jgi:hypothetical protein
MKRSYVLKLIANQLDFLNGKFQGARDDFSEEELSKADVILTTLEDAGMKPPAVKAEVIRGKDYKWGAMCTMRCNCSECEPDYPMHKWERK